MKENTINLKVKITGNELFSFMMKHTYSRFSGIFGFILSLACLVLMVLNYGNGDDSKTVLLLVCGLLYTVVNPVMLYSRAKKQALTNPMYKNCLEYVLNEEGISLNVDGEMESIEWNRILKFAKTGKVYILYTSDIHAILLPTASMGNQKNAVETLIKSKVRGK